jgi:diguanylate cyclase (GGDEF)-like protein
MRAADANDSLAQEIRAQQYFDCTRMLPFASIPIFAIAGLAAWRYSAHTPSWLIWVCLSAVAIAQTDLLFASWRGKRLNRDIGRRDLWRVTLCVGVVVAAMMLPTVYWFPNVALEEQLLIAVSVAGLIGAGGFVLSPIASAGLCWTLTAMLIAAITLAIAAQDRPIYWIVLGMLLLYGIAMSIFGIGASRSLVARALAERRAERQRDLVGLLLRDFEGSSRDWLWETDQEGRLRHASVRLAEVFDRSAESLEGLSLVDLLRSTFSDATNDAVEAHDFLRLRLASRQAFRDHIVPVVVGSEIRWWSLTAKPLFDPRHLHVGWRGVGSDVTESQLRENEMMRLANYDHLTGLANRRQFRAQLDTILAPESEERRATLFVLDLDNFKSVNDTLGHWIGDQVLHEVAKRLQSVVSADEVLARLGGDEYALIVPGELTEQRCRDRGHAMLAALREPFHVREFRIEMRASIGVAQTPAHALSTDDLLKAADTALYSAKDDGRDSVNLFSVELDLRARKRAALQTDLGAAVENDELELHYQPQIDARSMQIVGFEALLRWRRNRYRVLSPAEFIGVAEETGLIVPIGTWAMLAACRDAQRWPAHLFVGVNISAVQFASRSLIDTVTQAIDESGLSATRLELEITESSLITDSQYARDTLESLRSLGLTIALDDFGTGYSSLAYLRSFPLDKLKIDRAFTAGLTEEGSGEASAIVRAIIQLASALRLKTVAEGVEAQSQLDSLRAKGCTEVQGYYFARPMPAQEVLAFIEAWDEQRHLLADETAAHQN